MFNTIAAAHEQCRKSAPSSYYVSSSPRAMSADSSSSTLMVLRKYVDPWDLDLREASWRPHSSDTTDSCSADLQAVSLSSAAGPESARSDFVYVPGQPKIRTAGSVSSTAMDDDRSVVAPRYDCCRCSPSSAFPPSGTAERYHGQYNDWTTPATGNKPPLPPYRYAAAVDNRTFYPAAGPTGSSGRCCLLYNVSRPDVRRMSRYNGSSEIDSITCRGAHETCGSSGEYGSTAENSVITSGQFRYYNTLGHVKIDYSSNWNNLDRYICQV